MGMAWTNASSHLCPCWGFWRGKDDHCNDAEEDVFNTVFSFFLRKVFSGLLDCLPTGLLDQHTSGRVDDHDLFMMRMMVIFQDAWWLLGLPWWRWRSWQDQCYWIDCCCRVGSGYIIQDYPELPLHKYTIYMARVIVMMLVVVIKRFLHDMK